MDIVKNAVIKQVYSRGKFAPARRVVGGPDGLLSKLVPFDSQGAMWARRYNGDVAPERLGNYPDSYSSFMRRQYTADGLTNEYLEMGPLYVVYSYSTPIAWVTGFGEIEIPDHKYSVTTTHHQNMCRAWLGTHECDKCWRPVITCAPILQAVGGWM